MAGFKLTPAQGLVNFGFNLQALSRDSDKFHITVWIEGEPARDCTHVRITTRFFAYVVMDQMGEHRVYDLEKIREVRFWLKSSFMLGKPKKDEVKSDTTD